MDQIKIDGGNVQKSQPVKQQTPVEAMSQPPKDVADKLGWNGAETGAAMEQKVLSAEDILKDSETIELVEIEGLGFVKVKPLSMGTSLKIQKAAGGDLVKQSMWVLQQGLVEPKLSPEQIQNCKVGVMTKIVEAINKASGLEEGMEQKLENF